MIEQQLSLLERTAPDPHEVAYFGWAIDAKDPTPEETAARAYERKHGCPPEHIIDVPGNILLLGPIPEVTL